MLYRSPQAWPILLRVKPLEDEVIPNNSILREFIGGSVFKDAL